VRAVTPNASQPQRPPLRKEAWADRTEGTPNRCKHLCQSQCLDPAGHCHERVLRACREPAAGVAWM
jgi:hypothetical protein